MCLHTIHQCLYYGLGKGSKELEAEDDGDGMCEWLLRIIWPVMLVYTCSSVLMVLLVKSLAL